MQKVLLDNLLNDNSVIFSVESKCSINIHTKMHYMPRQNYLNFNYILNLVKSNLQINLLYVGFNANSNAVVDNYYGLVVENGMIAVAEKDKFTLNMSRLLGTYKILYEDDQSIVYQKQPVPTNISFAIVMATYYRPKGNTKALLERTVQSIRDQTYNNYKLFLIGDHYTHEEEFETFADLLPADQIEIVNLPVALERENCRIPGNLWSIGGANAMNHGLDLAEAQGYTHYVHLDDDDCWNCFHLRNVAQAYHQFSETAFVCTYGITEDGWLLPHIQGGLKYNNFKCTLRSAFHSSFGFRLDLLPYRYTTLIEGYHELTFPFADGDMLNRIGITKHKKLAIPILSCFHDFEGNPDQELQDNHWIMQRLKEETHRTQKHNLLYHMRTIMGSSPIKYWGKLQLNHVYKTIELDQPVDIQLYFDQDLPADSNILQKDAYVIIPTQDISNTDYESIGTYDQYLILKKST